MIRQIPQFLTLLFLVSGFLAGSSSAAATMSGITSEPFGTFDNVEFVRYTGRFQGTTSLGDYDVPFEIVAPADPSQGSGTVLLEPPHWGFPTLGRDFWIGRSLIFGRGMSYASVGFGVDGFNILDPSVPDLVIAGDAVEDPGVLKFAGPSDEEILIQFAEALRDNPFAVQMLGTIERTFAFGVSRSADILVETHQAISGTDSADIFDLTLLHLASWEATFPHPGLPGGDFERTGGAFAPLEDIGRVIYLQAEGDLLAFDAEQFELSVGTSGYRVYQIAGTAHLPTRDNPLDHVAVMRATFVAADKWMRFGIAPPPSTLLQAAPEGEIDSIYGVETGIARDSDGNALGGVRLPELEVGQALFIASDPSTSTLGIPFLSPLTGSTADLTCEPLPDGSVRFPNHGDYVNDYAHQANLLVNQGYLLPDDAEAMKERAAESNIGKPGSCD